MFTFVEAKLLQLNVIRNQPILTRPFTEKNILILDM